MPATSNLWECYLLRTAVYKDCEVVVTKTVHLPFVPIPDMWLTLNEDECDYFLIDRVTYVVEEDYFLLNDYREESYEETCPCKPEDSCCVFDPQRFLDTGWNVEEVVRGAKRRHKLRFVWDDETSESFGK